MDNLLLVAPHLIGTVLPPLIEVLNKDIPHEKNITLGVGKVKIEMNERFLATLAICLSAAAVINAKAIQAGSVEQLLASFALIFTESQTVYKLYFENSGLREQIQDYVNPKEDPLLSADGIVG